MTKWLPKFYILSCRRTKALVRQRLKQSEHVQQSTRLITGPSMSSWIRSARKQICIHMSSSTVQEGWQRRYYAIHSRLLGPNHVNMMASKAEMALQTLTYYGKKKAWYWKMYIAHHVKYHILLGNLMEHGFQGLDSGSKAWYLLSGTMCDKLSTAVAAARANPDKYKKDFDSVFAFLNQNIDKRATTPSLKVAFVTQTRPAKWQKTSTSHGTFKGMIELKKYSWEKYDWMSVIQHQQLYVL